MELNKFWAHSLMKRMNFVQRKVITSKSKSSLVDFEEKKAAFLDAVTETVFMEEIPAELVLNWDQTGIKLVPSSVWTLERQGEKRVEMVGINDKCQITAVFCGTMLGEFLPVQLIYQGKTDRCHPKVSFPWIGTSRIHRITGRPSPQCSTTSSKWLCHTFKRPECIGEDKMVLVKAGDQQSYYLSGLQQLLELPVSF